MTDRERCAHCSGTRTRIDEHMVVRCCDCGRDIYDNPATSGYAAPSELRVNSVSMSAAPPSDPLPLPYTKEELGDIVPRVLWNLSRPALESVIARLLATARLAVEGPASDQRAPEDSDALAKLAEHHQLLALMAEKEYNDLGEAYGEHPDIGEELRKGVFHRTAVRLLRQLETVTPTYSVERKNMKADRDIEQMTYCMAMMAAALEAADRSLPPDGARYSTADGLEHPTYYAARARALYDAVEDNVAHASVTPTGRRASVPHDYDDGSEAGESEELIERARRAREER